MIDGKVDQSAEAEMEALERSMDRVTVVIAPLVFFSFSTFTVFVAAFFLMPLSQAAASVMAVVLLFSVIGGFLGALAVSAAWVSVLYAMRDVKSGRARG